MNIRKTTFTSSLVLAAVLLSGCGANQPSAQKTPADEASTSSAPSQNTDATATSDTSSTPDATSTSDTTGSPDATSTSGPMDLSQHDFPVTWEDALHKAQDRFNGDVSKIELESRDGGGYEYKVELMSDAEKYAVQIDADSGEIVSEKTDSLDDGAAERQEKTFSLDGLVSLDDAMNTATEAQDGPVNKWKVEGKESGPRYEFDITDPQGSGEDHEVQVDARSGKVVDQD
ncbi:PepSY domain-containing protein [Kocuria marina]|uniref:PepSY domain-containing protein n=1 Tax=Kocuria marina TaxID=223184 RepID=UPI003F28BC84